MRAIEPLALLGGLLVGIAIGHSAGARGERHRMEARPIESRPAAEADQPHAPLASPEADAGGARVPVEAAEPGPVQQAEDLLARAVAAEERAALLESTLADVNVLRFYLRQAEDRAALEPDGQIGQWAATQAAPPDQHTQLIMASLLHDYPVVLEPEEGMWIAERVRLEDWHLFGRTTDEAIVLFLGADRIAQACAEQSP